VESDQALHEVSPRLLGLEIRGRLFYGLGLQTLRGFFVVLVGDDAIGSDECSRFLMLPGR
jgi:hypothetical protein